MDDNRPPVGMTDLQWYDYRVTRDQQHQELLREMRRPRNPVEALYQFWQAVWGFVFFVLLVVASVVGQAYWIYTLQLTKIYMQLFPSMKQWDYYAQIRPACWTMLLLYVLGAVILVKMIRAAGQLVRWLWQWKQLSRMR